MRHLLFYVWVLFPVWSLQSQEDHKFMFGNKEIPAVDRYYFKGIDTSWEHAIFGQRKEVNHKEIFNATKVIVEDGLSGSNVQYINAEGDIFYLLELKYIPESEAKAIDVIPDVIVGFDLISTTIEIEIENTTLKVGKSIVPFLRKTKLKHRLKKEMGNNIFHFLVDPIVFKDNSCSGQILTIYSDHQNKITRLYLQDDYEYTEELILQ